MKNIHIKPNRGLHFCISRCNRLCNLVLSLYIRGFVPKVTRLHWLHLFFTKNIFFYFLSYISNRNRQQQYLLLFFLSLFIILFMSSMLPPSIILPPETAPDEPIGSQTPTVDPNTGLNPYFDQFNQMQQGFQNTMQQIQNDPFPLLEHFLGQRAMSQVEQAMQPMQQEALQKVSGVMSGIRSLVNEAFPNMSGGGISTTGQLGQGIASLGGTAIPAAPFTPPAEIPSTPMQPPMMGGESIGDKLFGTKMTDIVGSFGSEVTTPAFTGPNSQNTYVGGTLVTPDYVPKVGLGGDPDAPKTNLPPAQMLSLFNQQMGGPVTATANPTPKVPSFMDESGGAIDFSIVSNPVQETPAFKTSLTPIGQTNFDDLSPEKQSEMLASLQQAQQNFNSLEPKPMVGGSGMGNPMALKNPLINLAYNFNMENSPF